MELELIRTYYRSGTNGKILFQGGIKDISGLNLRSLNKVSLPACRLSVYNRLLTTFTDIPYTAADQEARNISLPLTLQPGEIALIILGLKYTVETDGTRVVVANKEWQPVDIIGAAYLPK